MLFYVAFWKINGKNKNMYSMLFEFEFKTKVQYLHYLVSYL